MDKKKARLPGSTWLALAFFAAVLLVYVFIARGPALEGFTSLGTTDAEAAESLYEPPPPVVLDMDVIRQRDTLVALTTFNSTSYFIYRGEPLGYEYDLLKAFAEDHDLALRVVVVRSRDSLYAMLNRGEGDIVAARIIPTGWDSTHVGLTQPLYRTEPVLVQRGTPEEDITPDEVDSLIAEGPPEDVPDTLKDELREDLGPRLGQRPGPGQLKPFEVQARLVTRPTELAGEEVHVERRSAYYNTLIEVSDSITGDIHIVEAETEASIETLLREVASGEIEYTVSGRNLAELTESTYSNLVIRPSLGEPLNVTWAVRRNAPQLQKTVNDWIAQEKTGKRFKQLYQRYFIDRKAYQKRLTDEFYTPETGKLSAYDDLLRRYADTLGWDWRLLASQTFQESRFDPEARSWAGAAGLLQLMPPTAREFGVSNPYDPEDNVAGAVRFLEWLRNYWDDQIPDEKERLRFILASYNTGHGHVEDARRLTKKYGGDINKWEDVAYWLLQKSKKEFYSDEVVKYGFCRGLEPVSYVSRIIDRYEHFSQFTAV